MDRTENVGVPFPQYLCPVDGRALPLAEARMSVTCAEHQPRSEKVGFTVREATSADRRAIEEICDRAWGETEIDVYGKTFDVLASDNMIAVGEDGELVGLISCAMHGGDLAVVVYSVYPQFQGRGVGTALLETAASHAAARSLTAVKAAVSNDDLPLLYFYQRHGFIIAEIVPGLLADRLGYAGIGFAGIPIRDEIRLRRPVCRIQAKEGTTKP
jgi:ribosomal protein S18 acetylase RimI-like enzyme